MNTVAKKILIVEDDQMLLDTLSELFTSEGFDVIKASDGKQGLEVALANHPDIMLLDVLMPVMDGMTVMKNLRQDAWGKKVPVIVLTNLNPNDEALEAIVRDQPAYYLIKSNIKIDEMLAKVREVLGMK